MPRQARAAPSGRPRSAPPPRLALSHASRRFERQPSSDLPLKTRPAPRVRTRPRIERWQRAGSSSLLAVATWGRRQRTWALATVGRLVMARRPPNYRWKSERGRRERRWEARRSELTLARSLDSPESHGRRGRPSSCSVPWRLSVEGLALCPSDVKTCASAERSGVPSAATTSRGRAPKLQTTPTDAILHNHTTLRHFGYPQT